VLKGENPSAGLYSFHGAGSIIFRGTPCIRWPGSALPCWWPMHDFVKVQLQFPRGVVNKCPANVPGALL